MLIFAHRGASAIEPENTLPAFQAAYLANCEGVEFDIHYLDGEFIVIHDRYLDRTTSGSGLLNEHSFVKLRQLDAGKGAVVPTLAEVLAVVSKLKMINIELKGVEKSNLSLLFECLDNAIKALKLDGNKVLLSSFNHQLLQAIHQQRPEFKLAALTAALPIDNAKFAQQLNAYSVHIVIDYVNKTFVNDAHQRGLKVYVYTVDELADIQKMKAMGVDGIFANNPKEAKRFIKKQTLK